jgi:hypothetical protein
MEYVKRLVRKSLSRFPEKKMPIGAYSLIIACSKYRLFHLAVST